MQRHPRWFDRPDDFLPERFLPAGSFVDNKPPRFVYAPFGGGPRAGAPTRWVEPWYRYHSAPD